MKLCDVSSGILGEDSSVIRGIRQLDRVGRHGKNICQSALPAQVAHDSTVWWTFVRQVAGLTVTSLL